MSAYGQETTVTPSSVPTPNWRSAGSDVTLKSQEGVSALTAVYALPERVELTFSAPVKYHSASLRGGAGQPDRFYLDISPAALSPQRGATLNINSGPIRRVRFSLFRTGVIRVVLDLREVCKFELTTLANPYRLVIIPQGVTGEPRQSPLAQMTEMKNSEPIVATQQKENKTRNSTFTFPQINWRPMPYPWSLIPHTSESLQEENVAAKGTAESVAADLASFDDLPQVFPLLAASIDSASFAAADVSTDWLWEATCQGEGCPPIVENSVEVKQDKREKIQTAETSTVLMGDSSEIVGDSMQHAQETLHIGGSVMNQIWLMVMAAGVFLSFLAGGGIVMLWNLRKRGTTEKGDGWEGRMAYLEEAVNRAGMLNNSFFHSLEVSQKRLETLLTQSDVTERNLRRLLHQSAFAGNRSAERNADSLETASILLSEGEEVQQVARTLKLPMAQVRLLQELRTYTQEEKPAGALEKSAARVSDGSHEGLISRRNGASPNGMHIANGSQL